MKQGEHALTRNQRLISLEHLLEDVSSVSPGNGYTSTLMQTHFLTLKVCFLLLVFLESSCKGKAALKRCPCASINEKECAL